MILLPCVIKNIFQVPQPLLHHEWKSYFQGRAEFARQVEQVVLVVAFNHDKLSVAANAEWCCI